MSELRVDQISNEAGNASPEFVGDAFVLPSGPTSARPQSPVAGMIRFNTDDIGFIEFYNADKDEWIQGLPPLGTVGRPAQSAQEIIDAGDDEGDGVYFIDLPVVGTTEVFCIMDPAYDGGGWMLALKATRGTTFRYVSSYWTSNNTLNTGSTDQTDADAKFEVFNQFEAKDLLARFPDIGNGGSLSVGNWTWLENSFPQYISSTTSTLLNLFNTANRTFIQDAKQFSGYGSAWSSQTDVRFYGFNYEATGTDTNTRWGFGWNENGGGLFPNGDEGSADVAGGIGIEYRGGTNYSAGDFIGCCQDSTGINRSARVEVYVR